jgi:peroxin-11B
MARKKDALDRLVVFLAKRDGIDKLVKTFQYVGKLCHYHLQETHPALANRFKKLEIASGLSRKAFRTGRFLTGYNALRTTTYPDRKLQILAILGNGGEMVYWFFDHFVWLAKVGVLDPHLAKRFCYISAFGEAFGYIFFNTAEFILISRGLEAEKKCTQELAQLLEEEKKKKVAGGVVSVVTERMKQVKAQIAFIRLQRIMSVMAIIANLADFFIALADVEPNPFVNHAITLGLSGLASAWAGWYRNWPD